MQPPDLEISQVCWVPRVSVRVVTYPIGKHPRCLDSHGIWTYLECARSLTPTPYYQLFILDAATYHLSIGAIAMNSIIVRAYRQKMLRNSGV